MSGQSVLFDASAPIDSFSGEYRWLSNFYPSPIQPVGRWWGSEIAPVGGFATVEHAYQATKVEPATEHFVEHYNRITGAPSAGMAKKYGSAAAFAAEGATVRRFWDEDKVFVMLACLRAKFALVGPNEANLWMKLAATSPRVLIEGNTWNDTYWGTCNGQGKNMLGRLLMLVRAELLVALAADVRPESLR